MTASYVTVILDLYDGAGNQYVKGTMTWVPSQSFPDVADQMDIGQAPVTATFRAGSLPQVRVIANDTAGPQQGNGTPGWTWNVTYSSDTPGSPAAASYYVLSTNGSTQRLSSLASVPAAQPGSLTVPAPSAAPVAAAEVLAVSQVSPLQTAWQVPAVVTLPPPTGVAATDTAAIQNAENALHAAAGGKILFQPGTYVVSGLVKYGYTTWQGAGRLTTVIQLASGANADVVQGYQFGSLTGTGSTGGITGWAIRDLMIDGNGSHQTGASYGLRTYGYNFDVSDVEISGCFSDGFYSEWGNGGANMEARVQGCKIHDNNGIGLNWQGPHDSLLSQVMAWDNAAGQVNFDTHATGTLAEQCHVYGTGAYGVRVAAQAIQWADSQAECAAGEPGVLMLANGFQFIGGSAYDIVGGASTAFIVGDGTHAPTMCWVETYVNQTNASCVNFANSGGDNYFGLRVLQNGGAVVTGTPGLGDTVALKSGSFFTGAGALPQTSGSLTRRLLPDPGGTAYWCKLGTWSTTAGGRLRLTVTGAGSYDGDVASNARTVITASTGSGTPTPNIQGYWFTEGGTPAVDQVKCAKGATAETWVVWAHVVAGFTGNTFVQADTGSEEHASTFTWSLTSGSDPGVASSTVAVLAEQYQVHSPALFPGGITVPPTQAMVQQATTGLTGYSLVNGTGTILSWTAPNDGLLHRVTVKLSMNITVSTTGGTINATFKTPDGAPVQAVTIAGGTQGVGYNYGIYTAYFPMLIAPGSTFSIVQATAMTAGTAKLWAEIWGS